ncbi:MAG: hypothetical protein HQ582_22660 [Planctomycetes bacterium]|nr:hypothetical protein [Planctomycetota bacterium]
MGTSVLLVEGDDDQHVMWNLFEKRQISGIYVLRPGDRPGSKGPGDVIRVGADEDSGGDTRLLESIPARLDTTGLERLAVVLDADYEETGKGPKSRWAAICGRLDAEGYENLPKLPEEKGTVCELPAVRGRKPIRFGAWIMPNNGSDGMLEDFVANMIQENDDALSRVDPFLDSIPETDWRFKEIHRAKARVHTWLAVSERPGRPMGQAIKADSHLDANHPTVEPFLAWVRRALID